MASLRAASVCGGGRFPTRFIRPLAVLQSRRNIASVCSPLIGLNDEQKELYSTARALADKEMKPKMKEWDHGKIFPVDFLKKTAELGFAAIYVPEKHGGSGLSRLDTSIIFDALSTGDISTAAYISIHNMCAGILSTYGSEELISKHMENMVSMSRLASYCLTEPNAGSDAASLVTTARLSDSGSHYILNGSKCFISGAGSSHYYFVMCRTGGPGPKGISCLLVEKDMKGVGFGKNEDKVGWNSQPTRVVTFEDVEVPVTNLLGKEGEGFSIAMKALNGGRINIASCSLGGAQAAIEDTIQYVKDRKQFNTSIASFQNTQFELAENAYLLSSSRLMVRQAAKLLDKSSSSNDSSASAASWCALAKYGATENCFNICDRMLQLHGGYGYLKDYSVQQFWRDTRVNRILEGTNEIMRVIVGKEMMKH